MTRPIRFQIRPATLALLRQAQQALEDERGERLDDDAQIAALSNAVLAGAADDTSGRARHQVMAIVCDACKQGWTESAGRKFALDAADTARVQCDAQRIGADARATQDVAPKVVRFVKRRDGGRCCVPGCRSARYLEVHHIVPREHGGSHDAGNLTLLCDGHHRALHEGKLTITGTAPELAVRFTHVGPPTTHARDAELALTTLGFRIGEARGAIAAARVDLEPTASLEQLIVASLKQLAPH